MTLSRFLRDYLYVPLGGSRKGRGRRYVNLMATMLLGGLWHGAGWTFVMWGGLHGLYLVVHQVWQHIRRRLGHDLEKSTAPGRVLGMAVTFLAVVVGWVFFRAESFDGALNMLAGMAGMNGVSLPDAIGLRLGTTATWLGGVGVVFTPGGGRDFTMTWVWIVALLPIVFLAPNTQQIMSRYSPALPTRDVVPTRLAWSTGRGWAVAMAVVAALGLLSLTRPSEFLYFQF
jgi:hypothetical protein